MVPCHWVYNRSVLETNLTGKDPEFFNKWLNPYYVIENGKNITVNLCETYYKLLKKIVFVKIRKPVKFIE